MAVFNVQKPQDIPEVFAGSCICFGVFDGVHVGHQFEIKSCCEDAKTNNTLSFCCTFDIDPDELFCKDFYKLMDNNQRISELEKTGVDNLLIFEFDAIKNLTAQEFLDTYFCEFTPKSIHVGQNFHFGKNNSGNTDLLLKWGHENNMKVYVHDLIKKDGRVVSSSWLRELKK